ncbi:MAG: N-acetylmuramoyl-L-alanine amidase, partial [Bacillota bacterium]
KDVNMVVALKMKNFLKANGYEVKLSRTTDVYVDLGERCRLAIEWKTDFFISVHHNSGGGDGYEVIHSIYFGKGLELAGVIAEEFKAIGQNAHGKGAYSRESEKTHGKDYYEVIRNCQKAGITAIIVEFGFIDTRDAQAFDTPEEQYKEAAALAKGITRYIRGGEPKVQETAPFVDVPVTHPNYAVIKWAKDVGLVNGYPDGTLKPDEPLSLGRMLQVLKRYDDYRVKGVNK